MFPSLPSRGEYHGSLKRPGAAVSSENNPVARENTRNVHVCLVCTKMLMCKLLHWGNPMGADIVLVPHNHCCVYYGHGLVILSDGG